MCVCVEVVCEGVGHTIAHTICCCLGAHHGEEVDEEVGILPDDQVRLDGRLLKPLEQFRTLQTDRETISSICNSIEGLSHTESSKHN